MFAPLFNSRLAYSLVGPQLTGEPVVPIDRDLTYIWCLWLVFLVILLAPVVLFLRNGWLRRKNDILSSISRKAAALYLRFFHGGTSRAVVDRVARAEAALPPDPEDVQAIERVAVPAGDPIAARREYDEALNAACKAFDAYYTSQFGRWLFMAPASILATLTGLMLLFPAALALAELRGESPAVGWHWVVGLAVLGGYTRVVYDLVVGMYQENIRPADLLWGCYRLLISVPLGFAAGKLLDGNSTVQFAPLVAFLLGLFPTYTVLDLGRRIFKKWTRETDFDPTEPNQLKVLPAMDGTNAAVFEHEGLPTFTQLAYADPIRLSIRTGLGFSFLTNCASESMLAIHLLRRSDMEKARKYGVCGAYEAFGLWKRYREGVDPATLPEVERISQARAAAIVGQLATDLGFTHDGLKHILSLIAADPYMEFIYEAWGSNVEPDG